jgi:hypothetical protein
MMARPRLELEDSFAREQACSICGETTLSVVHLKGFPDYVTCARCGAAFVMEEGGTRAMYGSIPPEYPETREFALKQWTAPEAIVVLAAAERPRSQSANSRSAPQAQVSPVPALAVDPPEAEPAVEALLEAVEPEAPLEPFDWPAPAAEQVTERAEPMPAEEPFHWPAPPAAAEETSPEPEPEPAGETFAQGLSAVTAEPAPAAEPQPTPFERPAPGDEPTLAAQPSPPPAAEAEPEVVLEPDPGRRFRVRFLGSQARIPAGVCVHCLRTPARRSLVMAGVISMAAGQARRSSFTLPLCGQCHRRARARSDEERSARLTAHLISVLLAAVVMVGALALRLVRFADAPLIDAALLAVLGLCAYGIPALLLLGRSARMPPPQDALFVRSTLLVSAQPAAGETLFDWRNAGTASRFQEANPGQTGDTIFEIADPLARPEPSHHEPDS